MKKDDDLDCLYIYKLCNYKENTFVQPKFCIHR